MSVSGSSGIIKTTARYREPGEPPRQRPVIQVADPAGNRYLPNTIRASLDSGRDNPFRPDGPIYKSADPIVDYYKNGANLSRPQSPTDSQILLGLRPQTDSKRASSDQSPSDESHETKDKQLGGGGGGLHSTSCWRKCFCCCIKTRSKTSLEIIDYSDETKASKRVDTKPAARLQTSEQQLTESAKLSSSNWSKLEQIAASQPGFETCTKDNKEEHSETGKSAGRRCVIS